MEECEQLIASYQQHSIQAHLSGAKPAEITAQGDKIAQSKEQYGEEASPLLVISLCAGGWLGQVVYDQPPAAWISFAAASARRRANPPFASSIALLRVKFCSPTEYQNRCASKRPPQQPRVDILAELGEGTGALVEHSENHLAQGGKSQE
jgi:hypothetical protein